MPISTWTFLVFLLCSHGSVSYKLLVVFPYPMRSHNNLGNGIVRHLLTAGHEVTYITPFPTENPPQNLHQIDVASIQIQYPANDVNVQRQMDQQIYLDEYFLNRESLKFANFTLHDQNVVDLLNDPEVHFDIVIAEWLFSEVFSGLASVFNCPYIWVYPYEPSAVGLSLIDEATNPAYVPQMISKNVAPFTFLQRVEELYNHVRIMMLKFYYFSKFDRDVYKTVFTPILAKTGRTLPPFDVMRYNASLMLGCSHVTLGQPIRLPQNYKDIGGYHIDDQVKPLPKDLQKIMDEAINSVIYFSMGTNIKSKDLPYVVKTNLLKVFSKMKQTVLWKFEEYFENIPSNVHIIKWAPQQSILAHKNCKLFISHGGLLSITEAVHFGVPIVGIPVFVDQFNNVDRAAQKGFAKRVDLTYNLAEDLRKAVDELVRDPRFSAKAQELSAAYHDRVVPPGPELVHWVEHVVRTRGAPHLRSPAIELPFYQKLYLDLAALVIVVVIVLRMMVQRLFRKQTVIGNKKSR